MIDLSFWYLFPVGISIAIVAMSSGISGSNFWMPVFLLWLGLSPRLAFWLALLTMMFGFGSGVYRNVKDGTVDWSLAGAYLWVAAPATALGAWVAGIVEQGWVLFAVSFFVLFYGIKLVVQYIRRRGTAEAAMHTPPPEQWSVGEPGRDRVDWGLGALAGFLKGALCTGLGMLIMPRLLQDRRLPSATAVGTTVVIVLTCNAIGVIVRLDHVLLDVLSHESGSLLSMMIFIAPGVVIGGQIGPWVARRLPRESLRLYVGVWLVVAAVLIGLRAHDHDENAPGPSIVSIPASRG